MPNKKTGIARFAPYRFYLPKNAFWMSFMGFQPENAGIASISFSNSPIFWSSWIRTALPRRQRVAQSSVLMSSGSSWMVRHTSRRSASSVGVSMRILTCCHISQSCAIGNTIDAQASVRKSLLQIFPKANPMHAYPSPMSIAHNAAVPARFTRCIARSRINSWHTRKTFSKNAYSSLSMTYPLS